MSKIVQKTLGKRHLFGIQKILDTPYLWEYIEKS